MATGSSFHSSFHSSIVYLKVDSNVDSKNDSADSFDSGPRTFDLREKICSATFYRY